jgi:hypothetical protein
LTLYVAPEEPNLWASLTVIRLRIRKLFRGFSVKDLLVILRITHHFDNTQNGVPKVRYYTRLNDTRRGYGFWTRQPLFAVEGTVASL